MNELAVVEPGLVEYRVADEWQRALHARRVADDISDVVLLLEHPHVYTLGRRFAREHLLADEADLAARGICVHEADRGGSITYHGPGQLVGYPILDLRGDLGGAQAAGRSHPDVVRYLRLLEEALIRAVGALGVAVGRREGLTGVWAGTAKLAAIGVNVSRGVTKHGFALNVCTDLSYFEGMVACGVPAGITSLAELLDEPVALADVCTSVASNLAELLGLRPVPAGLDELLPDRATAFGAVR